MSEVQEYMTSIEKIEFFITTNNEEFDVITVSAVEGTTLLQLAREYKIPGVGKCGGSMLCATCHVELPQSIYDDLPTISSEENQALDFAFNLTKTSRLGCQIKISKNFRNQKIIYHVS